jgi:hypothetical protein
MDAEFVVRIAEAREAARNSHDLERILVHYVPGDSLAATRDVAG